MLIAQRPSLGEEQIGDYRSKFTIEPLEPGFGYTIGNSLRRTLLSSIPGAAVTSIRIEGVLHEFTTVPGVKEDVTDIILNLKQLVVSSEHDEPVVMYLRKQGPGAVTAADIAPPAGVEVHNPELHIATLNSKGKLEMELTVERGRGYVSATQNKQPGQEIVKEDVTDLILNIKQLVVSSEHDEPVVMYLRKQGPGAVTAADIAPPAQVEVHTPELHIATLNGKGKLEMELTVERGRGYVSAVQNKQQGQEIGRIPVDSIYSPVLKVTYKVEATRVEQRTDFSSPRSTTSRS